MVIQQLHLVGVAVFKSEDNPLAIRFSPMSDRNDVDDSFMIVKGVQDSIVTRAHPPQIRCSLKFPGAPWMGILCKLLNLREDSVAG